MPKNRTERILEMAVELAKAKHKSLAEQFEGQDVGMSTLSDEEFFVWYSMKTGRVPLTPGLEMDVFPPAPYILPNGETIVQSPWEMALEVVSLQENRDLSKTAQELLDRYKRSLLKVLGGERMAV